MKINVSLKIDKKSLNEEEIFIEEVYRLNTGKEVFGVEKHIAVIDAGTTGTRMTVYGLIFCGDDFVGTSYASIKNLNVGISTLLYDLKELTKILKFLLEHANKTIKKK